MVLTNTDINNFDHYISGAWTNFEVRVWVEGSRAAVIVVKGAVMGWQSDGHWRPISQTTAATQSQHSRPNATAGVTSPPKPEARSIDLSKILPSYSLKSKMAGSMPESQHPLSPEPETDTSKE